jgi:hypothetical protein
MIIDIVVTNNGRHTAERIAARVGVDPDLVIESPHFWVGSVDAICADLEAQREELGISYFTTIGDPQLLQAGAEVARLAGR